MKEGNGGRPRGRTGALLAACAGVAALEGCAVLERSTREYSSNEPILEAIASSYAVDSRLHRLLGADVRDDSITYQYTGVEKVGDHAWVVRFSQKSSEQSPDSLMNVAALLPLIAEGRKGFEVVEEGEKSYRGLPVTYVRYRFESPIRDGEGRPFPAHGIVAAAREGGPQTPIVWQIKLDNHGDRDDVTLEDLVAFLDPIVSD